jgi:hypothetical protein
MVNCRHIILWLLFASQHIPAYGSEELHYHLSYSGLVTGYIWKDLADMTLNLSPEVTELQGQPAARIQMEVTTANYGIAEAIHALRYRWESILSTDLQRTLLVRVVDQGDSDRHDIYWYDWQNKSLSLFRKRKQRDVSIPLIDEEPKLEWEKNNLPEVPEFIDSHPTVAPGLSYLIQTKHIKGRLNDDAIDPLTMLQRLRHHNYREHASLQLQIINEADLAPYQARFVGSGTLKHGSCSTQTLKLKVRRSNRSGEDGVMTIWLSDDERRIPLRIDVEAPLGMLHVELQSAPSASITEICGGNDK